VIFFYSIFKKFGDWDIPLTGETREALGKLPAWRKPFLMQEPILISSLAYYGL